MAFNFGNLLSGQQSPGPLSGIMDPSVMLPIAAQIMAAPTFRQSLAGGAAAAGPAIVDMRKRQAVNAWLKARSGKGDLSPEMVQFIQSSPDLAEKLAINDLSLGGKSREGMTSTIKVYDAEKGITKVMQYNPETGKYDTEAGIAPPASGTSIEYDPEGGGFRVLQGEGVTTGSKLPLGRTASGDLQKDIAPLQIQQDQVAHIRDLYDPAFLTTRGRLRGWAAQQRDKLRDVPVIGAELAPSKEDEAFLSKRTAFRQNVEQVFNQYRKDITGAAAALAELDRLKQSVINTDQSPAEFEAALSEFEQALQRGLNVKTQLLKEGIPLGSKEFGREFDKRYFGEAGGAVPATEGGWSDVDTSAGKLRIRVKPQ